MATRCPVIKFRIIVKNGNATLDGVLDSEADKNLVIRGYSQVLQLAFFSDRVPGPI
jgi:hypothetical protein